ncbi:MAG: acyloxyacyl hydrolase [Bacteroidales bacterium]|nr:acyloxyacyl hydrolase [Bacteroidales bacterium]
MKQPQKTVEFTSAATNFYIFSLLRTKCCLLLIVGISLCFTGSAEKIDSIPKHPLFVEAYGAFGTVFGTNEFVTDVGRYEAFSLRFARSANGSSRKDFTYNMPFYGIGFYKPSFENNPGFGNPFSFYMFRGSTLSQFTDNLGLVLEMNLGLAMNWTPYDLFDNPNNIAIGSHNTVQIGLRLYLEYVFFRYFQMKFGFDVTHFSNGNTHMPNRGVNMGALSFSLAYNFNPVNKGYLLRNTSYEDPVIPRHLEHDVEFLFSNRQTMFDTTGNNLPSPFVDADFKVLGLLYNPMIVTGHKFKWGPSIRLLYDESSNARAWRELHPDGQWYNRVEFAKFTDRLSLGLALHGEISMPIVSVFASIGYNVYHKHHYDKAFFQTVGIKTYLKDNLFVSLSISTKEFYKSNFLCWTLGYTLNSKRFL